MAVLGYSCLFCSPLILYLWFTGFRICSSIFLLFADFWYKIQIVFRILTCTKCPFQHWLLLVRTTNNCERVLDNLTILFEQIQIQQSDYFGFKLWVSFFSLRFTDFYRFLQIYFWADGTSEHTSVLLPWYIHRFLNNTKIFY